MKSNNFPGIIPNSIPYPTAASLTHQVPYLTNTPNVVSDERFGFLPFIGGLAVGGLLFGGGGGWGGGRPCCVVDINNLFSTNSLFFTLNPFSINNLPFQ